MNETKRRQRARGRHRNDCRSFRGRGRMIDGLVGIVGYFRVLSVITASRPINSVLLRQQAIGGLHPCPFDTTHNRDVLLGQDLTETPGIHSTGYPQPRLPVVPELCLTARSPGITWPERWGTVHTDAVFADGNKPSPMPCE